MASNKPMRAEENMKFDFGNEVVAKIASDTEGFIEKRCVVVGITPVENAEQVEHFKQPAGTVLYTVEFGDGSDALIPEGDLRAADSGQPTVV
jgi:hypothetical protein